MMMVHINKFFFTGAIWVVFLLYFLAAPCAMGQSLECSDNRQPIGYLGISALKCHCAYNEGAGDDDRYWYFHAEPEILGVDINGPAAGKLLPGDVIVAINKRLITTHKAGIMFANPVPGESVELVIRREGKLHSYRLNPSRICPDDPRIRNEAHTRLSNDTDKIAGVLQSFDPENIISQSGELDAHDHRHPRGWLGLSLSCSMCCVKRSSTVAPGEWQFGSQPVVYAVDSDSPASEAGFIKEDIITHIDGIMIDTEEGGKRFSDIKPGQEIEWTVQRNHEETILKMCAEHVPLTTESMKSQKWMAETQQIDDTMTLQFSGSLGDTEIEVRGKKPIVVNVYESKGEIFIDAGDTIIKLKNILIQKTEE